MALSSQASDAVLLLLAVLVVYVYQKEKKRRNNPYSHLPLPPTPKGSLPILGNMLQIPTQFEWETYHRWCTELDTDVLYLNIAGTPLVVLDTAQAAMDLLEKRSSIYSGRPRMPMLNELMRWDFNFAFREYGTRKHRRVIHDSFHPSASKLMNPQLLFSARRLLNRILVKPDNIIANFRHMAGETIMAISYGIQVKEENDPYVTTAEAALHGLCMAALPGAFLVDALPFLKHVPSWFPGAGFQRKAQEWKDLATRMKTIPFELTKQNIAKGNFVPSFTSRSLARMESDEKARAGGYEEYVIQNVAGTMYAAGTDTTVSALSSCFLGMLSRPEIVKRAHEELDRVIKPGHLPDFDDEDSLPYISALAKESLRWKDPLPVSIPHLLDVDDEYKGYRLPAGAIIVPNAWAMLHDPKVYPDPFSFRPERFLKEDGTLDNSVRDPSLFAFGFGRRICPARYMAYSAIWITIATILTVYDVKKAVDEDGNEIEPTYEYFSGLVCMPLPYKCSLTPRSKEAEKLIKSAMVQEQTAAV
ncbi:cytochrome P450 [Agrocybe pediades]|nr:cytochrome P450 [Agrocybe pediades]